MVQKIRLCASSLEDTCRECDRVTDTVASRPTSVFDVQGRASQEPPGIKSGLRVDHPISLSDSGLSGQCGVSGHAESGARSWYHEGAR